MMGGRVWGGRDARGGGMREHGNAGGMTMAISGELHEADWSVEIETIPVENGGYRCRVHVMVRAPDRTCEHVFPHHRMFATEREAALEGLRSGMTWIEMKKSDTFTF